MFDPGYLEPFIILDLQAPFPQNWVKDSLPPDGAREQVCNSLKDINVVDVND